MAEFVSVRDGEEPWQPVFEEWGITQALLPADSGLSTEIVSAGWETVHQDENFVVLRP
jgi:hypothetical protein